MRPKDIVQTVHVYRETNSNNLPNNLGDPSWYLHDEDQSLREVKFLDWKCSDDKIVWAQSYILRRADGYVNQEQKIVVSDLGTWNPIINKVRDLCEYWEHNHPNTSLSRWTEKDVVTFIKESMIYVDEDGNECVKHHGQEEGYRHILYRSHQYFLDSSILDGLRIEVNKRFTESILDPYIKKSGISLAAWLKGGSYGSIPIENGMVAYSGAIQPPIPGLSGHPFRFEPDTISGINQPFFH